MLLEGIGYIYLKEKVKNKKKFLRNLCLKYGFPAFGIIYFQNNKIEPFVYVKETDSLFAETACGSGSIAFSIMSNKSKILQPTGEIITVFKKNNTFIVKAKITIFK